MKCTFCPLHEHATTNKMEGSGPKNPVWLFVGEAPGRNEDQAGEPFVGKFGKILRGVLKNCGFDLDMVGFTNSNRCWPGEGNRTPKTKEIVACNPFLIEEIKRRKPKVVVLLGAVASESILGNKAITKTRGIVHDNEELGCKVIATFHPGLIARQPKKFKVWAEDLQMARSLGEGGDGLTKLHPGWVVATKMEIVKSTLSLVSKWKTIPTLDIEYHGEPWEEDSILLMISFAFSPSFSVSIPVFKSDSLFSQLEREEILVLLGESLEHRARLGLKVGAYNGSADIGWMKKRHGWELPELHRDPYLGEHLLYEDSKSPKLSDLAIKYTKYGNYDSELRRLLIEEPEKYNPSKGGSFDNFPIELLGPYNAADSAVTLIIGNAQHEIMQHKPKMMWLYENVVVPANKVIAEFHNNGVRIDLDLVAEFQDSYPRKIAECLAEMKLSVPSIDVFIQMKIDEQEAAWQEKYKKWKEVEKVRVDEGKNPRKPLKHPVFTFEYKPTSDFHNREIVFDIDGIKPAGEWTNAGKWVTWKTDGGLLSFNDAARHQLKDKHPLPSLIDEYKTLNKMYGTYIKNLSETDSEGIYHPWFDLTGTVTGRTASNLQQLPTTGKSKDIKRLIMSRFPGGQLLNVDISQGELRMLAIMSRDEKLIEVFKQGGDAHTTVATDVYSVAAEDVTPVMRRACKTVGFGIIYGQGPEALAKSLEWSKPKTKKFIFDYFRVYKGVDKLIKWLKEAAIKKGFVYNLMGRERRLPDAALSIEGGWFKNKKNVGLKNRALRQAVNAPIQSLLHDVILWAECKILETFEEEHLNSLLCAEVHDSIIVDVAPGELKLVKIIVKTILENVPFDWITVPVVADVQVGPNLAEMTDI